MISVDYRDVYATCGLQHNNKLGTSGLQLGQPMGGRLVKMSDISGRMARRGVSNIQEINIPHLIVHITHLSWGVWGFFVGLARLPKVT